MKLEKGTIGKECISLWMSFFADQVFDQRKTFVEQGGSSLNMVMLLWKVNEHFDIDIDIADFIVKPSYYCLVQLVERALGGQTSTETEPQINDTVEPETNNSSSILPLSSSQKRLWLIDQIEGPSAKYNVAVAFKIEGNVDAAILEKALQTVLTRHHVLRSHVVEQEGEPTLVLREEFEVPFHQIDVRSDSLTQSQQLGEQALSEEAHHLFDLANDILVRVTLIRIEDKHYTLLINMHHLVSDGWSLSLVTAELSQWVEHFSKSDEPPETQMKNQFFDYSQWQQRYIGSEDYQQQLGYWQEQLAGLQSDHDIPMDFERPDILSNVGGMFRKTLAANDVEALKLVARQCGVTSFVALQAVFALLIGRWSKQSDIAIGAPFAGRKHREYQALIGFFANTLVIRNNVQGDLSFNDYLRQAGESCKNALSNQDVPFDKVVEALNPQRQANLNPFFQTFFALQDNEVMSLSLPDAVATEIVVPMKIAKFDLSLHIFEGYKDVIAHWEYSTDVFSEETIREFSDQFDTVLTQIITDPAQKIDQLATIKPQQINQMILGQAADLTKSAQMGEIKPTIDQIFTTRAAANPEAIALKFSDNGTDRQIAYGELAEKSRLLASQLITMGVKPGQFIGLYANRSIEMIVAVLGIMQAGAVYCPLDMKHPVNRLHYIVEDAGIELVLVNVNAEQTPDLGKVAVHSIRHLLENPFKPFTAPVLAADAAAYLLYTSGSTGKPKGVIQRHQTICNLVHNQKLDDKRTTLQFTPITFDVSIQELASAWHSGSALVLLSEAVKDDMPNLPTVFIEQKIERVFLPPALLNVLCEVIESQNLDLPELKEVIVAGEALHLSGPLRSFFNRHPNCVLWNHYGPTETHVVTTYQVDVADDPQLPPIGTIVDNCHGYILNPMGVIVPWGAVGELCISGPALAAGYCNNAAETDEKFITNPYANLTANAVEGTGHEVIYRTGDLVRATVRSTQSELQYVGRIDNQVKIRGFRIELSEIEKTLLIHKRVTECKVTKQTLQNNDVLIAYVVLSHKDDDRALTQRSTQITEEITAQIIAQAESDLPQYMVPNQIIVLEHMPLTRNGKVDVKALPAPEVVANAQTLVLPTNATETALVALWGNIFTLDGSSTKTSISISTEQSFFSLGGHSLLLLKLVNAIKREFATDIKLAELFSFTTITQQAELINRRLSGDASVSKITKHAPTREGLPMSYQQKRLWFLDQMLADKSAYNVPVVYALEGEIDLPRLQQAFTAILAGQDILKTIYRKVDGTVQASLLENIGEIFSVEHLPDHVNIDTSINSYEGQWVDSQSRRVFDLEADVMLDIRVLKVSDTRHLLMINMHHIATDGLSQQMLLQQLQDLYNQSNNQESTSLPINSSDIQYTDYAAWQKDELDRGLGKNSLDYWIDQLNGCPALHSLPLDFIRPEINSQKGETLFTDLADDTVKGLTSLAEQCQTTTFMLLQGAFALLVGRWSLQDDIVIGTPISGRNHQQVESTFGLFVNTIALRNHLSGNPGFVDYLDRTKTTVLDALEHGDYPFELLVENLITDRKANYNPLFQLTFSMSNAADLDLALKGLDARHIAIEYKTSKVDLSLHIEEHNGHFKAMWTYNSDIFAMPTINKMAKAFNVLLAGIVQNPEQGIHSYDLLDATETEQLVKQQSASRIVERQPDDLFARFEKTAIAHNNDNAIGFMDQTLSYGELLNSTLHLSHQLVEMGAKTGDRIGINLPRSIELISAMLAITRVGGCFVMLDPAYPRDRLAMMQADADITLIITTENRTSQNSTVSWPDNVRQLPHQLNLSAFEGSQAVSVNPNDPAYIIYTSGSTGRPKGVAVSHKALLNLCDWHIEQYGLDNTACSTQMTETGFDAAVWDIWVNLLSGARLQIVSDDQRVSPVLLQALFAEKQVTHTFIPTGLLHALSTYAVFDSPQLRYVFTGGDTLDSNVLPDNSKAVLVNHYGPTEGCVVTTAYTVPRSQKGRPPIGQPIDNARVYVVNKQGKLQPEGAPGELHIGGLIVANGYINVDKGSGASAFMPSPYESNEQIYKTGDLVKWTDQGELAYIGRIDHQVKIRGFRIELSEVEQALITQPQVEQARVAVKGEGNEKHLLAFVRLESGSGTSDATAEIRNIRKNIALVLPPYMRPAAVFAIDEFPLTVNGKFDTAALAQYDVDTNQNEAERRPLSETENALLLIWQEVLDKEQINVSASFFEVGGHSLLAMKLLARVEAQFNMAFTIGDLFQNQTIEDMALIVDAHLTVANNKQLFSQQSDEEEVEW